MASAQLPSYRKHKQPPKIITDDAAPVKKLNRIKRIMGVQARRSSLDSATPRANSATKTLDQTYATSSPLEPATEPSSSLPHGTATLTTISVVSARAPHHPPQFLIEIQQRRYNLNHNVPKDPLSRSSRKEEAKRRAREEKMNRKAKGETRMDLRNQRLKRVPERVTSEVHLEWLNLSNNKLKELPLEMGRLTKLNTLRLYGNRLQRLPFTLANLKALSVLDVGRNQLCKIEAEIGELESLTELNLSWNYLTYIPCTFALLTRLTTLNLSSNKLTSESLPVELATLTSITQLDLSNNQLSDPLPACLFDLYSLTSLNLMHNSIGPSVDDKLAKLTALTELDLRGNILNSLPSTIGALTRLTKLYLRNNALKQLPPEIGDLLQLDELSAEDNELCELPADIGRFAALSVLRLANNQLRQLPPEIGMLVCVRELDLRNNQLMSLPVEISQMTSLQTLNLYGNHLHGIPAELPIGLAGSLRELELGSNLLITLPDSLRHLSLLTRLDVRNNRIEALPRRLWSDQSEPAAAVGLFNLAELQLGHNRLKTLPADILRLTALTSLNVFSNGLLELPSELLASLSSLRLLHLSYNPLPMIDYLPAALAAPAHTTSVPFAATLTALSIAGAGLEELPREIFALQALKELNLANNRLQSIPDEVERLRALESLLLSGNLLSDIGSGLCRCVTLRELDLSCNELRRLPPELAALTALEELDLSNNFLEAIPPELKHLEGLGTLKVAQNDITKTPPKRLRARIAGGAAAAKTTNSQSRRDRSKSRERERFQRVRKTSSDSDDAGPTTSESGASSNDAAHFSEAAPVTIPPPLSSSPTSGWPPALPAPNVMNSSTATQATMTPTLQISWSEMKGMVRRTQEDALTVIPSFAIDGSYIDHYSDHDTTNDACYIGLFDGHRGKTTAVHAALMLHVHLRSCLKDKQPISTSFMHAFASLQGELKRKKVTDGSTALISLVYRDRVYVANAGDSRAIIFRCPPNSLRPIVVQLTYDHKPECTPANKQWVAPGEQDRIREKGGWVDKDGRVNGLLSVSRSLGDLTIQPVVTYEPYTYEYTLKPREDRCLVIACDGLWDVMSPEMVWEVLCAEADPLQASIRLRDYAYMLGSYDNLSVAVIFFEW